MFRSIFRLFVLVNRESLILRKAKFGNDFQITSTDIEATDLIHERELQ